MGRRIHEPGELAHLARSPLAHELIDAPSVIVDMAAPGGGDVAPLERLARVVIGIGNPSPGCDVAVADETAAATVADAVERHPVAATTLALLLRSAAALEPRRGLIAESAAYSMLQAGSEHAAWLAARPVEAPRSDDGGRVRVGRHDDVVSITLARPVVRNAIDAAMQQALVDAIATVGADDRVVLSGDGPCFSSGGDLREFGTRADPAAAHLLRLERSAAAALLSVASRTTAFVHGPCHGGGVELAAFAGRIVAAPGATFTLPEIGLGLIPGAGGTVSIAARVGRHRFAWLALTAATIDAGTALEWGLVDEIADSE